MSNPEIEEAVAVGHAPVWTGQLQGQTREKKGVHWLTGSNTKEARMLEH